MVDNPKNCVDLEYGNLDNKIVSFIKGKVEEIAKKS